MLRDQYAFKPTGSTTAALTYFMYQVTSLLKQKNYVRCLLIDFSKAFDKVDHIILVQKLKALDLPVYVVNWICSLLTGRSQQYNVNDHLSKPKSIGLSVVQGSGIGPMLYAVMKSDLQAISRLNTVLKYADDTTLVVPEHIDVSIHDEYEHAKVWAFSVNKLLLNALKTKEIVFKRPRALHFHMPPALEEIEQLNCVKLLGVLFQDNLKMDCHVQYILSQCAQRMYLLKLLQHQGMPLIKLRVVVYSLIVSRIGYALPAWGGFVSAELHCKIDAMFKRLKRYGYTTDYHTLSDLLDKADYDLFSSMRRRDHCLHHVLPPVRMVDNLRARGHPYNLPECSTNVHKKSFVVRSLYSFI